MPRAIVTMCQKQTINTVGGVSVQEGSQLAGQRSPPRRHTLARSILLRPGR